MSIPFGKTFLLVTSFKVICQGQGRITGSVLKKGCCGGIGVSQTHLVFYKDGNLGYIVVFQRTFIFRLWVIDCCRMKIPRCVAWHSYRKHSVFGSDDGNCLWRGTRKHSGEKRENAEFSLFINNFKGPLPYV